MEKQYFYLKKHCYLLNGKNRSAIYDLLNKRLYSIDLEIGKLLDKLQNSNSKIKDVSLNNKYNITEIYKYLSKLIDIGGGNFFKNRVVIEKLRPSVTKKRIFDMHGNWSLNRIYLEIENKCNLECIHCIKNIKDRCSSCCLFSQKTKKDSHLCMDDYYKALNDAKLFNCQEVIIIGGEPLLSKNKFISISEYIRKLEIPNIILYSNGLLLDKYLMNFLKNNRIAWKSNLFSINSTIHDKITQKNGSCDAQVAKIKSALEMGIRLIINIEIMKVNQDYVNETIHFLNNLGIKEITYNFVTTKEDGYWPDLYTDHIVINRDHLNGVSKNDFFNNRDCNSCWSGQLAITIDGKILPCNMARNEIITSIKNMTIQKLLVRNIVKKYWEFTKDQVEGCKTCEFRYACFSCPLKINNKTRKCYCSIY